MFWIPLCFIAFAIYFARTVFGAVQYRRHLDDEERHKASKEEFRRLAELSSRENSELSQKASDKSYNGKIVSEFMNDGNPDWGKFTLPSFHSKYATPVHMAMFAEHGKVPSLTSTLGMYTMHMHPGDHADDPEQQRIDTELTEKLLLKVESILRANGVRTTLVANYQEKSRYVSVRDYVSLNGYGVGGVGASWIVDYRWSNFTHQWKDFEY